MAFVYIVQIGPDKFRLGRHKSLNECSGPIVWSKETEHAETCELFLRKKLEPHDAHDFYEIPSSLLPKYLREIEALLATYIEAETESSAYAQAESSDSMLPASDEAKELFCELEIVRQRIALLECEKTFLENRLKALIGNSLGIQGVATWKTSVIKRLDAETVKTTYPDIYQSCLKETKSRRFCIQK